MKTPNIFLKTIAVLTLLHFVLSTQTGFASVGFSVTPNAISNTYNSSVTMQISGLTSGDTVLIQKYLDLNSNGVVDAGDMLCQQFQMTDGSASVFHDGATAVTNFNVPGDTDGSANGQITTKLYPSFDFAQMIVGQYLFVLSSPAGHFSPITITFNVTNFPFAQSFTGNVVSNSTSITVSNAVVIVFQTRGNNNTPVGGAVANNSGAYSIKAPPGTYALTAYKSNYVANFGASQSLTLASGTNTSTNLNLIPASVSVSGRVVDTTNSAIGLPGLLIPLQSTNNLLGIAFTDTNGNFSGGVTGSNTWKVGGSDSSVVIQGYIGINNKPKVAVSNASVPGISIALAKATAVFYGTVKDTNNNPVAGLAIESQDANQNFITDGFSTASGNYVAGAIGNSSGDSWGVQKDYGGPANYIYSQGQNGISLSTGQAYQYNFTGLQANYVITGNVQYNGAPVSGVGVYANATINGLNFNSSTDTDTNGNYSLAVGNGSWSVSVNCNGGNDSLDNIIGGNYQCPNNQNVTINNGNGTANFNVQSGGGGNAATIQGYVSDTLGNPVSVNVYATNGLGSNLSTSTDGSGYYEFTNLSAGNWDVSLDCGNLSANGYGCVNAQQTYVSGGQYDEVDFTVPDCGTLQVYTTFLPDGLSGSSYSAPPLQNIGCNSPFTWSLSPGSEPLPPGLTISSGGVISGTPGSVPFGGTTYYFSVRVTDGTSTTADQSLNITVYPVLTIGSNALPNGTVGIPYSAQVLVSGGDQNGGGYGFFYNGSLPPGLNVNSGAITSSNEYLVISGTPTNVGTFTFTLSASDDDGNSVQRGATIRILSSSLSIVTTSLSNATVNANYSYQLQASGGTPPYSWTVAQGSQPLPTGLTLATNGLISGIPTVSGTNSFIVRVTDQNAVTTTRSLTLVINGGSNRPSISAPARLASQRFQFTVNGTAGQNYTIQYATGLRPGSSNWISLLVTNSAASSFTVTDTNASNNVRFYRVMVGP